MRTIAITQVRRLVCGREASVECARDLIERGTKRALFVTGCYTGRLAEPLMKQLREAGVRAEIDSTITGEPTVAVFEAALLRAREYKPDAVVGLGGGSALDTAKLAAALLDSEQSVAEVYGIGQLRGRRIHLACLPTTSGTGSEVSPNAILLDERAQLKKGVISPWLVPDATYIDPLLMLSVPEQVTAGTGMDALSHCIEAYANKVAHPMIDLYALEGIRLISRNLLRVLAVPDDVDARESMAIGSLYGGLCLGPVNTAAIHALSYPLGGRFHVPHGISNAILMPHVLRMNLSSAPGRYAEVARALGVQADGDDLTIAELGVQALFDLTRKTKIPMTLTEWKVPVDAIETMAASAMEVTRLLKNNPRSLTVEDAKNIYRAAMH